MARIFKNDKCLVKGIMVDKLKVVWICHLSNKQIRNNLHFCKNYYLKVLSCLSHKSITRWNDFAVWNTNAIKEFEHFQDIELTVIFPFAGIKGEKQEFEINGVHYIAFRSEDDHFFPFIKERILGFNKTKFPKNRKIISQAIKEIKPVIVHVIGVENPYYSLAALDVPNDIPCVVSLQTLMSAPGFLENYRISKSSYNFRSETERKVILRSNYLASNVRLYQQIVATSIKNDAVFLNMPLAINANINTETVTKEYDFVYFAANISKAADIAIESFAIAQKKYPGLKLNVSGDYSTDFKTKLDQRIKELGIVENVFFTGPKSTHDEVICQIKKSKYALLPLKVDLISSTIREAMACGLPVVTTITPSTPKINKKRECILLSEKSDYQAMADNMIRLVENKDFASYLSSNSLLYLSERDSNEKNMKMWRDAYYEIIENFESGKPFTEKVLL